MGNYFTIAGFLFSILLFFVYFSKKRINLLETKIYGYIVRVTFAMNIMAIASYYTIKNMDIIPTINNIVSKGLLICYLLWIVLFTTYMLVVSEVVDAKNKKGLTVGVFIVILSFCFLIFFFPLNYNNTDSIYSYGPAANLLYIFSGSMVATWLLLIFRNIKNLKDKKFIPLFAIILLGSIVIFLQKSRPELLLLTYLISFITFLMYFTIENPDLKLLRESETAKLHAEKANRAKSDFLASMSHEIRTPLNAIVGLTEDNMSHNEELPDVVKENNQDIFNASQTLLEIVGNILDINRIEAEKIDVNPVRYDLREEVDKICKMQASRIGDKPIQFYQNVAEDVPIELIGDKVLIKQILNNLLSNAIKYTEEGQIKLDINTINRGKECMLIINVSDTGRGIKKEYIDKLFGKFERLDIEKNTTTQGTGLGLAITKSYIEMMGGKINVQSEFGKGSLFVVTLPQEIGKQDVDLTNTQVIKIYNTDKIKPINIDIEKPIVEMQQTQTSNEEKIELSVEKETKVNEDKQNNKKVLIVDDNKLNLKVASRVMSGLGFEIDEVLSGEEAINKINEKQYDLILMDIMMPKMSGEETLQKLKENPNFNIPVIAVTADVESGSEQKYLNAGFVSYIGKPFTKDQIKSEIDKIFK